jgi:guanine deaminase
MKAFNPIGVQERGVHAILGFDDQLIYEELGKPRDERKLPLVQLLGPEALQELKRYAANPQRVSY